MKYLLDTCVISEVIKPRADKNIISWIQNQDEENLYLSVLTFGEIKKGIEKPPDGVKKKKITIVGRRGFKKAV